MSIRRNEGIPKAAPSSAGVFIEDVHQQHCSLLLRDVVYRLFAEFTLIPLEKHSKANNPVPRYLRGASEVKEHESSTKLSAADEAKYVKMFARRASKGQCFNQPYLGCREFSAAFRLVDPDTEPATPIKETRDLGWMLYDFDYSRPGKPKPQFFHAVMKDGVIDLQNVEVH